MTWWVIQKRDGELEYKIGPFQEKEMAERWIKQAIIQKNVTLEIEEIQ